MPNPTSNLALPQILSAQAQKHVTHNDALRLLDGMVQIGVLSRVLTAPPGSPAEGDRYIVASGATGLWAGWDLNVAFWTDGAWLRLVPRRGWVAWSVADAGLYVWNGTAWTPIGGGMSDGDKGDVVVSGGGSVWTLDPAANAVVNRLGLGGATPDATNRLSVNAPAALFNNAGTSFQMVLNKAAAANDALLVFQTGFSTRAIFGTGGSDDFTLKVSPNGSTFYDAVIADRSSGRVHFPVGVALDPLAADPGSPSDGWLWFNSTASQLRARLGGITRSLADEDIPWLSPVAGDFLLTTTGAGGAAPGTLAGAANQFDLFPFSPRADVTLDRLAINCTGAVASALTKIAVYTSDANGRPDQRLTETGDLDCSTTGTKLATVSLTLRRGTVYWIGVRHNSNATLSAWAATATPDINGGAIATTARKVLRRTLTYASAAPASWAFVSSEINAGPATAVWLRAA
jgi:hypothetical protein